MLVDDELHCVISDFGQSEMKSEAYRISGTPPPRVSLFALFGYPLVLMCKLCRWDATMAGP